MQNVQRVIFERDYKLVHEYWQRSQKDLEDLHFFGMLKTWFEKKHKIRFCPDEFKKAKER